MGKNPTLLIILLIAGVTLFIVLIRYLINRGVDKAADAIRNSRVRNQNEQAGSVYNAPVQRSAASVGTSSAVSANTGSGASTLRPGVEYLRNWYPNYKPAKIRHGLTEIKQGTQQNRANVSQTNSQPNPIPPRTAAPETTATESEHANRVDAAPMTTAPAPSASAPNMSGAQPDVPAAQKASDSSPSAAVPVYPRQTYPIIRIASDTASSSAGNSAGSKQPEEPLRGFLKAIVIIYYVCTGLMPTVGLIAAIAMFSSAALLNRFGISAGFFVFLGILMLIVCIGVGIVSFRFAKKIVNRDVTFLRYYHTAFIVCVLLELFLLILMLTVPVYGETLASYSPSVIGEMIISILQGAAGTIGLTVFFVRSRYVHAYMGSDDYLYQSPFTRRYARFDTPSQKNPATNTAQSGYRLEKTPNYSSSHCCICGKLLDSKYAVLFVSSDGSEARVDRTCYEALRDLGTSEDLETVTRAKQYIFGKWISDQKKELSDYLKRYEQSAIEFLRQNRISGQESDTDRR